jgi:hypothetical protein
MGRSHLRDKQEGDRVVGKCGIRIPSWMVVGESGQRCQKCKEISEVVPDNFN